MEYDKYFDAILKDTVYEKITTKQEEPIFYGSENFFDLRIQAFNANCAMMTMQTKITNIHNLSVHEFTGLFLQVQNMLKNG